ncbi:MAG: site-2 protease family protein [Armatimonadetes bacterium]|nr:site-2 protease family protein [Armatimonadota bacterium]
MAEANALAVGIAWYVVFLFSTVLHEASHALAAKLGGDDTAERGGQVSLDPLPHIQREPFGMVLVPILSFFSGGWMIGWASTPYDPWWADRYPHRAARMALAGPLANLLIAVLAAVALRVGMHQGWFVSDIQSFDHLVRAVNGTPQALAQMLSIAFCLNVFLFAFNLMPLPPLDGSGVIGMFMSESAARQWQNTMRQPALLMGGILIAWLLFGKVALAVLLFALELAGLR